ncbi:MAG: ABC transporter permease, partial [Bacteroidota bacterium]
KAAKLDLGGAGIDVVSGATATSRAIVRSVAHRLALAQGQPAPERNIRLSACDAGLIGVILGVLTSDLISALAGWKTVVSPVSIILAFAFSAAVGIFFGMYPARKAAQLNPIDALRYE